MLASEDQIQNTPDFLTENKEPICDRKQASNLPPGWHFKCEVIEDDGVWARGISESNVFERQAALDAGWDYALPAAEQNRDLYTILGRV